MQSTSRPSSNEQKAEKWRLKLKQDRRHLTAGVEKPGTTACRHGGVEGSVGCRLGISSVCWIAQRAETCRILMNLYGKYVWSSRGKQQLEEGRKRRGAKGLLSIYRRE
ncbi:hypothetical protein PM082_011141 [Marasmius tenuissimus]|nr:hypothetical protein PM082_011141 [Marasmius tenuissimus]